MKCVWQKSRGAVVEGFVVKNISSVGFCFGSEKGKLLE